MYTKYEGYWYKVFGSEKQKEAERKMDRERKRQLRETAISHAISLIDDRCHLSGDQEKAIRSYINNRLRQINCCILWERSRKFMELLLSLKIPTEIIGRQEIILSEEGTAVLFSDNYKSYSPKQIFQ